MTHHTGWGVTAAAILILALPAGAARAGETGTWSGVYGGLHLGYGAGRDDVTEVNGPRAYFRDTRGVLGGAQLGWQKQIDRLVAGIELELGHLGQSGDESRADAGGTVTTSIDLGAYATLAGRVGYVPAPEWLVFARAGLAIAALDATITQTCPAGGCGLTPSRASTRDYTWGGVFGGGIERAFATRWSARVEYQYMLFVRELALPDNADPGPGWNHDIDLHVLKLGLNYRF
jgi:outer membrane immunogenic protein